MRDGEETMRHTLETQQQESQRLEVILQEFSAYESNYNAKVKENESLSQQNKALEGEVQELIKRLGDAELQWVEEMLCNGNNVHLKLKTKENKVLQRAIQSFKESADQLNAKHVDNIAIDKKKCTSGWLPTKEYKGLQRAIQSFKESADEFCCWFY